MSVGTLAAPETRWQDGLPPQEFWVLPMNQTIETPVDDRGLILVDDLIAEVKRYIAPEYEWPTQTDVHHLYFYAETYSAVDAWSEGRIPARRFRELAVNKILAPRYFHNVLHRVTRPAPMPSPEVMRHRIDAWTAASNLFESVRNVTRAERLARRREMRIDQLTVEETQVGREIMEETLARHFHGISLHLGALSLVPREFWPFDPELRAQVAAGQIGDIVLRGRQRHIRSVLLPSSN